MNFKTRNNNIKTECLWVWTMLEFSCSDYLPANPWLEIRVQVFCSDQSGQKHLETTESKYARTYLFLYKLYIACITKSKDDGRAR